MAVSLGEKEEELRRHASLLEQNVAERTQALQRTVGQLQQAEQIGMIGSWEWFIPANRVVASEGLYKLMGVMAGEFGDTMEAFFERIHPDDLAQTYQAVESVLKGKSTFEVQTRSYRADGELRYMYARGEAFYDDQGNPLRMIGIVMDVTERRQAEQALRESEDKFKYLFDYSIIGKSITYPDGAIEVNQAFADVLGYSKEELLARKWEEITHPEDIAESKRVVGIEQYPRIC